MRRMQMRAAMAIAVVASTGSAQDARVGPQVVQAVPAPVRTTETQFQLGLVTPTGDLGEAGGVGGGINFTWHRTLAATQHALGIRIDVPITAGTAKENADQGWTFIAPSLGVIISPPRARAYVLPYAFGGLSWNRVSALDLITDEEVSETGMGSAFGAGVELPVGVGRISFEVRTMSAGMDGWTASATSLWFGFVSGGVRPAKR